MKPEEVAAMRPTPAPVLSPDHPKVEDAIRNAVPDIKEVIEVESSLV